MICRCAQFPFPMFPLDSFTEKELLMTLIVLTLILKHISLCDHLKLFGFKQNFFSGFFAIFVFIFCVFVQGLFAENKEKLINGALLGLLEKEGDQNVISAENLEAQFHALRRLVASKAGFQAFTSLPK